jgi:hypothetical protein
VQERFEVDIKELPEQIDTTTYSENLVSLPAIFYDFSLWSVSIDTVCFKEGNI